MQVSIKTGQLRPVLYMKTDMLVWANNEHNLSNTFGI